MVVVVVVVESDEEKTKRPTPLPLRRSIPYLATPFLPQFIEYSITVDKAEETKQRKTVFPSR